MDKDDQRIRLAMGTKNRAALKTNDTAGDAKVRAAYLHARQIAIARGDNLDGDAKVRASLLHAKKISDARSDERKGYKSQHALM